MLGFPGAPWRAIRECGLRGRPAEAEAPDVADAVRDAVREPSEGRSEAVSDSSSAVGPAPGIAYAARFPRTRLT